MKKKPANWYDTLGYDMIAYIYDGENYIVPDGKGGTFATKVKPKTTEVDRNVVTVPQRLGSKKTRFSIVHNVSYRCILPRNPLYSALVLPLPLSRRSKATDACREASNLGRFRMQRLSSRCCIPCSAG